jgi:hypothetical protein
MGVNVPKGKHREADRVVLPNGMWLLLYESADDGSLSMKLGGYDRRIVVTELMTRAGGTQLFVRVEQDKPNPRSVSPRATDLVTVERSVVSALRGLQGDLR